MPQQDTLTTAPGPSGQLPLDGVFAGHRVLEVLRTDRLGTLHVAAPPPGEEEGDEEQGEAPPALLRVFSSHVAEQPELRRTVEHFLDVLEEVSSPWVAAVLERGEAQGRPYYVLDAEGPSLLDLIRRGRPLEEDELLWLGRGLCAGLLSLHAVGLAHGNLSPEHVLLGPRGPLLVDLGWSARLRHGEHDEVELPRLAADLRALGSLLVMAARGAPRGELGLPALGLSPRLAELIEPLLEGDDRSSLLKVARAWEQAARSHGGDEEEVFERLRGLAEELHALPDTHGEESAALDQPALGAFGRYLLLEEVARGGMGVVYRARHADFERVFALKVMLSGSLADARARARFLREAEAAAALDHPAIVRVHDCGEVDGRAYIAMDYAEGRPLGEAVQDMELMGQVLPLLVKIARAVHYAHARGVVHRDLKPDNVRVGPDGEPRILDFGLAKRIGEGPTDLSISGELVGTPAYMPPEQAEGRGHDIDTRSDVYALGATLYQVLTGSPPFAGGSVTDVLARVLMEEPAPPSSLRPEVPWELDAIVLKALEKEPDRRYQSAAELAEDLERFMAGQPIRARQATWTYRARKWAERRRSTVALVGGLVTLFLGALTLLLGHQWAASAERASRVTALLEAGQSALAAHAATEAKDCFLQAQALAPDDPTAALGRAQAEQLLGDQERQRQARGAAEKDREQAARLVTQGAALQAQGDLPAARRLFEQALAFDPASGDARRRLVEVERRIAEEQATERARTVAARDQELATRHEGEGLTALERGELARAQASLLKAVAFGSARAEELLVQVQERLDQAHLALVRQELAKRDAAEAARLIGEARAALEQGDPERARTASIQALAFGAREAEALLGQASEALLQRRQEELKERDRREAARLVEQGDRARAAGQLERAATSYAQALAFDGRSQAAQKGLLEANEALRGREQASRAKEAAALLQRARTRTAEARGLFRQDPDGVRVREAYLAALEDLQRAVLLAPELEAAQQERSKLASEAALVLREQGAYELADFLRRFGGALPEEEARTELPRDPHLIVSEADQVSIRRAFGGPVRFEATREFERVREWLQKKGDRYRAVILVKSEATAGFPPQVLVRALWVRLEDRRAHTVSAPVKIELSGGPYRRLVSVDAHGRIVSSFGRATHLDAERWVREVEETVQRLVAEAEQRE